MALRKQDLIDMWDSKNLTPQLRVSLLNKTGRGGQSAARDYIHALCLLAEMEKLNVDYSSFTCVQECLTTIHPLTRFRWKCYSPCLAFRYDELKESEQKKLFEDKNIVASEKMNGVRCWIMYYKGDVRLYSRNYSDSDCGLNEYHKNIYQDIFKTDEIFVVDTEIMFEPGYNIKDELDQIGIDTASKLEAMVALLAMNTPQAIEIQKRFQERVGRPLVTYRLIAPIFYKGKNYIKGTLGDGIKDYNEVLDHGQKLGFNLKPIRQCAGTSEEKHIFLETILSEGGEGVVFWNSKGQYNTSDNRNRNSFVKLKRSLKASIGMDDTVDGFVTGFKMSSDKAGNAGLIGSLEASIYILEPDGRTRRHVAAYLPNIPLEMKKRITIKDPVTGEISMDPKMYNTIVEMDAQSFSAVSGRLTHPRLLRIRTDKTVEECVYTREWISANTDGIGV